MSYNSPFAVSSGDAPAPQWHDPMGKEWKLGKTYGRSMSDVTLNGASYVADHYAKYNSGGLENVRVKRARMKMVRRGIPGMARCPEFDDALAQTWSSLDKDGFEPNYKLVPPAFKEEMARTGMTFKPNATAPAGFHGGSSGTMREAMQKRRSNPATHPAATFAAMFRDRDRRHQEWDHDTPSGPPAPSTPEFPGYRKPAPRCPSTPGPGSGSPSSCAESWSRFSRSGIGSSRHSKAEVLTIPESIGRSSRMTSSGGSRRTRTPAY